MIKIGLLGAAKIAPRGIINPVKKRRDVVITHLACRDSARGAKFCADNNLQDINLTDYADLSRAVGVDMIYCALPPSLHVDLVEAALLRGVHVLCEKPLAMNAAEAARMTSAAKAGGAVLLEAFHYYFHPAFDAFQQALRRAPLGGITSVRSVFTVPIPNRPGELRYVPELGGGALMDLGCYSLHAVRQVFGEPRVLKAKAETENGVDVLLTAALRCGDIEVEIMCDMRKTASRMDYIEVNGTAGRLRFDNFVAPHRGYQFSYDMAGIPDHQAKASDLQTYDYQLAHFIDMIQGAPPRLSPSDGIKQMSAIDALYAAAGVR